MMIRRLAAPLLLLLLVWLVAEPMVLVGIDAVRANGSWTLAAIRAFVVEPNEWRAALNSAGLALASVVLGGVIGVSLFGVVLPPISNPASASCS